MKEVKTEDKESQVKSVEMRGIKNDVRYQECAEMTLDCG